MDLLSLAIEQSSEGIAVTDLNGKLKYLNEAFAKMHGYSPEELVGKNLSIFHSPQQMPSVKAANQKLKTTGVFKGEIWHLGRDSTEFPTLMHNSLVRDNKGKPTAMIGTLRDITDRKVADEALRESEERLRTITDTALDSIFCKDINRRYTFVNPSMIQLMDCTEADLLEKVPEEVFDKEDAAIVNEVDERTLNGESISEVRSLSIAGKQYTFHTIQVPLHDSDGNITGISGVVRDITEQKRTQEALQRANDEMQNRQLMETNKALSILASNIERTRKDTEGTIERKIRAYILPVIEGLQQSKGLSQNDQRELKLLQTLVAGLTSTLNGQQALCTPLSPTEFRIAALVREGLKTNEIAGHMHISPETVNSHRKNIRKKLNLTNTHHRLRAHLQAALDR
jgi:PAS domain S-box-containing protein